MLPMFLLMLLLKIQNKSNLKEKIMKRSLLFAVIALLSGSALEAAEVYTGKYTTGGTTYTATSTKSQADANAKAKALAGN